jgi:hypothetical protein
VQGLQVIAAEREAAEEEADQPLRPDIAEALEAAHDKAIGVALKQAEINQRLSDAAYEQAAQAAQPRELFVRRGGEMGRTDRCRLRVGETVFARMPNGEYESVGRVNSNGEIPNEVIYDIQT